MVMTVNVSVDYDHHDGSDPAASYVVFRLNRQDYDGGVIVPVRDHVIALDTLGQGTVALWPNSRGTSGSTYTVQYHGDGRFVETKRGIYVNETAAAQTLSDLMQVANLAADIGIPMGAILTQSEFDGMTLPRPEGVYLISVPA